MKGFPPKNIERNYKMKKRILTAIVCAAAVFSFAGCASDNAASALANIASKAANEASKAANEASKAANEASKAASRTSKPTSSAAVSTTGTASSAAASKHESSANSTTSSATSNISTSDTNLANWQYSLYPNDDGESEIQILRYSGTEEKVEIPAEINGIKVTRIESGAFGNNIDITSITIPESITYIGLYAFNQCLNLSEITFKGSTPTLDGYGDETLAIFEGTPWLEAKKSEDPNFIIIGDTLIKGLECEGDITIPEVVKKIHADTFYNNIKITGVVIPDGVTEIGNNAFHGCTNLQSVNIPQNIVTIGAFAFKDCKLEKRITLPDSIRELRGGAFDYNMELVYKGTVYKVKDGYDELTAAIKQSAIDEEFGDKDFVITDNVLMKIKPGVTKIELPDTVKRIGDKAFENCDRSIIIIFKGKNYNLANLDKLKATISAN